jgi:hypothetical protein
MGRGVFTKLEYLILNQLARSSYSFFTGAPNEGGLEAPHGYNYPTSAATSISQATLHTVMARRPHFE